MDQVLYYRIKRLLDLLASGIALILMAPFCLGIALWIKADSPGPILYGGIRIGKKGKPFRMWKFRTMVVDADKKRVSSTAEDDPRLTRFGKFLRRYKWDELPQLWNVLRGDMSFVGPRPQVEWAVKRYTEEEKAILSVSPGITDYASLRFRNEGEILRGSTHPDEAYLEKIAPEKMRLGLEYVRNASLAVDFKILCVTLAFLIGLNPDRFLKCFYPHGVKP